MALKHPLFALIKEEHSEIRNIVSRLNGDSGLKPLLLTKIQKHHNKEETLLFPKLDAHPQICMGGPMCTYFFDDQITSPPLARAEHIVGTPVSIPSHLKELWDHHSPVRIPTGEHLALQHILENCATDGLLKNLNAFVQIMSANFQKEEECLFHVCVSLLSPDDLNEIYDQWNR